MHRPSDLALLIGAVIGQRATYAFQTYRLHYECSKCTYTFAMAAHGPRAVSVPIQAPCTLCDGTITEALVDED